jgi:hypothetical protein
MQHVYVWSLLTVASRAVSYSVFSTPVKKGTSPPFHTEKAVSGPLKGERLFDDVTAYINNPRIERY